ncbi:MarR family winged helix-turn-helix transcriptional regulator [Gordonia sihwensis]|uniref:MarR family winged helix-turn-helix transcriptional regulator n=1 Tax=Gordonia sihwensis TaxID=173559 RepID=UPI003D9735AA
MRTVTDNGADREAGEHRIADGALMSLSVIRLTRAVRRGVGQQQLTSSQAATLWAIAELAPVRPTDLAEREKVTTASMSKSIASLESAGLVSRTPDPHDGRVSMLDLTPAGQAYVRDANSERISLYETALNRLPECERESVVRSIALFADTMCELVTAGAAQPSAHPANR